MALEIKDIRIGNFFKDRSGKLLSISWIDGSKLCFKNEQVINGVTHFMEPYSEEICSAQPVRLNADWFTRFHFELDRNGNYWKGWGGGYLEFISCPDGFYPHLGSTPELSHQKEQIIGLKRILYVHELQNLWYWLVREELPCNLSLA